MKILFLSSVFPNAIEESRGCFNHSLVRALAIAHQVEVISPIPWIDLVKGFRRRVQSPCTNGSRIHAFRTPFRALSLPAQDPATLVRRLLLAVDSANGPVSAPDPSSGTSHQLLGSSGRRRGGSDSSPRRGPSCVIIGGSDVLLMTRKASRSRRVQAVLKATDAVITVNDDLKKAVVRLGIPADKVHVWHQGIDVGCFRPGDRNLARLQLGISNPSRVIVWVGRMVPVKGLDILLKSCALLRDRGVEYHLYLVGDGPFLGV